MKYEEEIIDKISILFEPMELDKTVQTFLNCSNQLSFFSFSNKKLNELNKPIENQIIKIN